MLEALIEGYINFLRFVCVCTVFGIAKCNCDVAQPSFMSNAPDWAAFGVLHEIIFNPLGYRVFTDSAPVLEAELAQRSGQGWRRCPPSGPPCAPGR